MAKFIVTLKARATKTMEIEANDLEDAWDKAADFEGDTDLFAGFDPDEIEVSEVDRKR